MRYTFLILCLGSFLNIAFGQAQFVKAGKVEYEKQVNMHKQLGDNDWTAQLKRELPEYRKTYFDLVFSETQSLYKPGRYVAGDKYGNWGDLTQENVSYANFGKGTVLQQKQLYEEKFLVSDSLLHIDWKIMDETRMIAGFECRKALGRFNDSLYVVAFFAEEILAPGGPEGFTGLPGLILGVAFPRLNTTWFATKLELLPPKEPEIKVPSSGKKVSRTELFTTVQTLVKRWSQWSDKAGEILWQLPW